MFLVIIQRLFRILLLHTCYLFEHYSFTIYDNLIQLIIVVVKYSEYNK